MTTPVLLPRRRPVPGLPGDSAARVPGPLLIVVGGVPGAGKSTLLGRVAQNVPGGVVLDPDRYRRAFARRLPSRVPYSTYRWAVHTLHAAVVVLSLLRGPRSAAPLLVHDTATRVRRRETLGLLARLRGWDPVLVAVDVSLTDALDGQLDRGRVVQPDQFVRHWERWTEQRAALAASDGGPCGPWSRVYLMSRGDALRQVRALVGRQAFPAA